MAIRQFVFETQIVFKHASKLDAHLPAFVEADEPIVAAVTVVSQFEISAKQARITIAMVAAKFD